MSAKRAPQQRQRRVLRAFKQRQRGRLGLEGALILLLLVLAIATLLIAVLIPPDRTIAWGKRCSAAGGVPMTANDGTLVCLRQGATVTP